jgi:hypothetical protein
MNFTYRPATNRNLDNTNKFNDNNLLFGVNQRF